ncbi:MAG: hypothetical protein R2867_38975 [Caldilineaceae bacterium]
MPIDQTTTPDVEVEVMFYTSEAAHEHFGMIDLATGAGTDVGPYTNPEVNILRAEWAAANGAIHEGDFYTILNRRLPSDATPAEAEARLALLKLVRQN